MTNSLQSVQTLSQNLIPTPQKIINANLMGCVVTDGSTDEAIELVARNVFEEISYDVKEVDGWVEEDITYYELSATAGNPAAQYKLGYCYEKGIGATQSYEMAWKWYKSAFLSKPDDGTLFRFYVNEEGEMRSLEDDIEQIKTAAQKRSGWAQSRLGDCYYYGHGVDKSREMAVMYYKLAAAMGCDKGGARDDDYGLLSYSLCYFLGDEMRNSNKKGCECCDAAVFKVREELNFSAGQEDSDSVKKLELFDFGYALRRLSFYIDRHTVMSHASDCKRYDLLADEALSRRNHSIEEKKNSFAIGKLEVENFQLTLKLNAFFNSAVPSKEAL